MTLPTEQELVQAAQTEPGWRAALARWITGRASTEDERTAAAVARDIARTEVMQRNGADVTAAMSHMNEERARHELWIESQGILKCMEFLPEFAAGKVTATSAATKVDAAVTVWRQVRAASLAEIERRARGSGK